jgi:hypothetical protein
MRANCKFARQAPVAKPPPPLDVRNPKSVLYYAQSPIDEVFDELRWALRNDSLDWNIFDAKSGEALAKALNGKGITAVNLASPQRVLEALSGRDYNLQAFVKENLAKLDYARFNQQQLKAMMDMFKDDKQHLNELLQGTRGMIQNPEVGPHIKGRLDDVMRFLAADYISGQPMGSSSISKEVYHEASLPYVQQQLKAYLQNPENVETALWTALWNVDSVGSVGFMKAAPEKMGLPIKDPKRIYLSFLRSKFLVSPKAMPEKLESLKVFASVPTQPRNEALLQFVQESEPVQAVVMGDSSSELEWVRGEISKEKAIAKTLTTEKHIAAAAASANPVERHAAATALLSNPGIRNKILAAMLGGKPPAWLAKLLAAGQSGDQAWKSIPEIARALPMYSDDIFKSQSAKASASHIEYSAKQKGLPPQQLKAMLDQKIKQLVQAARVFVRMPVHALPGMIGSGRFKTQFETGTTGGGIAYQERKGIELQAMGYGTQMADSGRPVYAFLSSFPDGDGGEAARYGGAVIMLKPEAAARCTISYGDSLDTNTTYDKDPANVAKAKANGLLGSRVAGSRATVPMAQFDSSASGDGTGTIIKNIDSATRIEDLYKGGGRDTQYVEAQVHGGIAVGDIEMVFLENSTPEAAKALMDAKIPSRTKAKTAASRAATKVAAAPGKFSPFVMVRADAPGVYLACVEQNIGVIVEDGNPPIIHGKGSFRSALKQGPYVQASPEDSKRILSILKS